MSAGRPLKFKSVEDMQIKIDRYFTECDAKKKPYTICGLAYALDCSRQTLMVYQGNDEYSDTITRAKDKCELYSAELLLLKEGSTKGIEFNLANNHSWSDKIDQTIRNPEGESFHIDSVADADRIIAEYAKSVNHNE